jgi:S-formylglutathione hydrolase FrmB
MGSLVRGCLLSILAAAAVAAPAQGAIDQRGAQLRRITITSKAVPGRRLGVRLVIPSGDLPLRPLLVFLHGQGDDGDASIGEQQLYDTLASLGTKAPVIAFPDGSASSYWHDRRSGRWARHVTDEVIPAAIRATAADPKRVAIGGISMGGFGALDIARSHRREFCAVGAHSPALWRTFADTRSIAFDGRADFDRHDLVRLVRTATGRARFAGLPVWLDAGRGDPFDPGLQSFATPLRRDRTLDVTYRRYAGGHSHAYWAAHWREYLRFYASALSRC